MFTYEPLEASKAEVRLLRPASNSRNAWTLETVSLDESPAFTALSYVWGDAAVRESIIIDGTAVQVTTNLAAALRHVSVHWRNVFPERQLADLRLWVDAVCINQDDLAERSQQVALMSRVFPSAEFVLSWLGEGRAEIELALASIEEMSDEIANIRQAAADKDAKNAIYSLDWLQNKPTWYSQDILRTDDHAADESYLDNRVWSSIKALHELEYWTRVWIFQEINLARRLLLVHGMRSLRFETLKFFSTFFYLARSIRNMADLFMPCPEFLSASIYNAISCTDIVQWGVINIFGLDPLLMENLDDPPDDAVMGRAGSRGWALGFGALWLLRASDPRDLIYGMLGVNPIPVQVSYDSSVSGATVVVRFLALFLEWHRMHDFQTGDPPVLRDELQFLIGAGIGRPSDTAALSSFSGDEGPAANVSWLPVINRTVTRRSADYALGMHLDTSSMEGWLLHVPRPAIDGYSLWCGALRISKVNGISDTVPDMLINKPGSLGQFYRSYKKKLDQAPPSNSSQTPLAAFVRALFGMIEFTDRYLAEQTMFLLLSACCIRTSRKDPDRADTKAQQREILLDHITGLELDPSSPARFLRSLYFALHKKTLDAVFRQSAKHDGSDSVMLYFLRTHPGMPTNRDDLFAESNVENQTTKPVIDQQSNVCDWLLGYLAFHRFADATIRLDFDRATDKRLAELENGRLAFVYSGTKVGDEVFLVRGCPTPLIMRQSPDKTHHILVGSCSIAGWRHADERDAADQRADEVQRLELR